MCRDLIMRAIEADVYSASQRAILVVLANRANNTTGLTWVSLPTIAMEAACSVGTARSTLRALEADNHISYLEFPGCPSIIAVHPAKDGVGDSVPKLSVATVRTHLQTLVRRRPGLFERVVLWLSDNGRIVLDNKEASQIALAYARKTNGHRRHRTPPKFVGVATLEDETSPYKIPHPPLQNLPDTPTKFEGEPIKELIKEPLVKLGNNPVSLIGERFQSDSVKSTHPADCPKHQTQRERICKGQGKKDLIEEFRDRLTPDELEKAEARNKVILASRNKPRPHSA